MWSAGFFEFVLVVALALVRVILCHEVRQKKLGALFNHEPGSTFIEKVISGTSGRQAADGQFFKHVAQLLFYKLRA